MVDTKYLPRCFFTLIIIFLFSFFAENIELCIETSFYEILNQSCPESLTKLLLR